MTIALVAEQPPHLVLPQSGTGPPSVAKATEGGRNRINSPLPLGERGWG